MLSPLVKRSAACERATIADNQDMWSRTLAENRIREAMAEGKFDNLPGAGQPLDLEEYFSTPEPFRMAHSILKSANCVPAEVELAKEINRLKQALADTTDADARASLQDALNNRRVELAVRLERIRRRS
jgi:hypothetical protein